MWKAHIHGAAVLGTLFTARPFVRMKMPIAICAAELRERGQGYEEVLDLPDKGVVQN